MALGKDSKSQGTQKLNIWAVFLNNFFLDNVDTFI